VQSIKLGQMVTPKKDRIFEYADHEPLVIWEKGKTYRVSGIFQDQPGTTIEIMVNLDNGGWENVPAPIFLEEFELTH